MWNEMSVTPNRPSVKRRYDASGRRATAARQRAVVLDAAWEQFDTTGFAATTVERIAEAAGVSTATIYKGFGGKSGLVRALVARALRGDPGASGPAEARSDRLRTSATDPRALVEGWGSLVAEVSPRVSPIVLLLRDVAASDPAAAELFAEIEADRLARMGANAAALDRRGGLRAGVSRSEARDVLWTYSAPDLYDVLVRRRGWSVSRYARFVTDALCAALL
jgi:AcrR family transcriptional regulator